MLTVRRLLLLLLLLLWHTDRQEQGQGGGRARAVQDDERQTPAHCRPREEAGPEDLRGRDHCCWPSAPHPLQHAGATVATCKLVTGPPPATGWRRKHQAGLPVLSQGQDRAQAMIRLCLVHKERQRQTNTFCVGCWRSETLLAASASHVDHSRPISCDLISSESLGFVPNSIAADLLEQQWQHSLARP
jgi:hypothetical protein